MRLFLPHKGWLVRTRKKFEVYTDWARSVGIIDANTNLFDEPENEAILGDEKVAISLIGRPEVQCVEERWYWTTEDHIALPEEDDETTGEVVSVCMGTSLNFRDYDLAVIELAGKHPPVTRLLYLAL